MPVSTAIIWLKAASAVLMIGLGLMFAIAAWPPASGLVTIMVDLLFWPIDGTQSVAAPETRIILAIGGGITAGWGVLVWQVATHLMQSNPAMARRRADQHPGKCRLSGAVYVAIAADAAGLERTGSFHPGRGKWQV